MPAHCLSYVVLSPIPNKRTALIIRVLGKGTRRYMELRHEIGRTSMKMATHTLRSLGRNGLEAKPVVPPRVACAVIPLGRTLIAPPNSSCHWSEKHLPPLEVNAGDVRPKPRRT